MTRKRHARLIGSTWLVVLLFGCASGDPRDVARPDGADAAGVTIMTFNVENLFDNMDDPQKDDKAYLPLSSKKSREHIDECNRIEVLRWRDECLSLDWDDATLNHKLTVVADTIRQVNGGRGADIIALQEVENLAILERLRVEYLTDLGYRPAILIEGSDVRGIDVAFLSRLPLAGEPVLHPLELPDNFADRARDTRGILEATFELPDGSLLTGFSVHFPAPFHPTAMRVAAYRHLNALQQTVPPDHNLFAAGDFNTTSNEDAQQGLLERFASPTWTVAHEFCDGCPGTHYYARDEVWSFLDMILYAPANDSESRWLLDQDSVRLAADFNEQLREDGSPKRYNAAARTGVSDHLPLLIEIEAAP
jgi:endonuclease/exonuclease/phosphatase family metal-dependent hydrolase